MEKSKIAADPAKTEWVHKNIKIEVNPRTGNFEATVNRMSITKPSLDAIKKYIDEKDKLAFEPFEALEIGTRSWQRNYNKIVEILVCDIDKTRQSTTFKVQARREGHELSNHYPKSVIKDTPENRKVLAEILAYEKETQRIDSERAAHIRTLREKVQYISVGDYLLKKNGKE